ncbi:MAG: HDOD domain-containing protein [Desulfobacterales bacterium]|nr:MAG: HDOD domain-containing protein [Desulfobacterales bacterium]
MKQEKLKHIMSQVKAFPGMPATSAKLIKMLKNPESSAREIEDILKYDPGLTANILKLTNSAYFGIPSKVSSVKQAIVLLGWKRLLQLVMTMCMSTVMKKPLPGYDLPHGELWRHSVAVSVAAELVVKALKIPGADEVFTAALLHDIGKLVLGGFVQDDLHQIEAMVAKGIAFEVAEFIVLGTDHAQIGARILEKWSFPTDLVNAVSWHHDPETCENHCTFSDIVHVANILGLMSGYGKGKNGLSVIASNSVTERLGFEPSHLEMLAEETQQGVNKLADILTIK